MTKPTQPVLHSILVVPHQETVTEREIRRRGGPLEVEVKRMRGIRRAVQEHDAVIADTAAPLQGVVLPQLGRMR